MGEVFAEITVKNAGDIALAHAGHIAENNVRSVTLKAIVDTGATTLVINEEIFKQLGLSEIKTRNINVAGGGKVLCKVTDPVYIYCKDRFASVNAVVMPEGKTLLGVIPLEFMDLMVDPVNRELIGVHGDEALLMAM
ncbi:aspartyl protease family protein [Treponema sp. R80B11-R83G3]